MSTETVWTDSCVARNFVKGVQVGAQTYADLAHRETVYGPSEGFVYFVTIGEPYPTHVKIGFTAKDPHDRVKSLQTGCPFQMCLLGFVFGTRDMERELHDVLRDQRLHGEWFEFAGYAEDVINGIIYAEAV